MEVSNRNPGVWALYAALLAAALGSCGCLVVAAGATAGGAALGYAFYKGELYTEYNVGPEESRAAVRAALADLQMPVVKDEVDNRGVYVESRTSRQDRVRIYLNAESARAPAVGPVTRVGVRVGLFGNRDVSERLLDQVGLRLTSVRAIPVPLQVPPQLGPIQPTAALGPPPQSPPPPLAN